MRLTGLLGEFLGNLNKLAMIKSNEISTNTKFYCIRCSDKTLIIFIGHLKD